MLGAGELGLARILDLGLAEGQIGGVHLACREPACLGGKGIVADRASVALEHLPPGPLGDRRTGRIRQPRHQLLLIGRIARGRKQGRSRPAQLIVVQERIAIKVDLLISPLFAILGDRLHQKAPAGLGFLEIERRFGRKLLLKERRGT